jgi:hypothetical protein
MKNTLGGQFYFSMHVAEAREEPARHPSVAVRTSRPSLGRR